MKILQNPHGIRSFFTRCYFGKHQNQDYKDEFNNYNKTRLKNQRSEAKCDALLYMKKVKIRRSDMEQVKTNIYTEGNQ